MAKKKIAPLTQRLFHIRKHDLNLPSRFTSNFIKTAKYGVIDFLPKTIFLQFKRYANIYFLLIAILQSISIISPLNPFSAIAPFVFVVALSILREFLEDLTRHRSDREANARKCIILEETGEVETEWKKVRVGDIVMTKDSDFFPADLLVIASSNPNGLCFIETSSLDGEKNLKPRTAPKETLDLYQPKTSQVNLQGTIECIQPNPMLSSFEGTLVIEGAQKVILNAKQLLYRGAKLKNTAWIVGIAVYTGSDTKLMKNSESAKSKQSKIERLTNKLILFILCFQILVCIGAAIGTFVFNYNWITGHTYIDGYYSSGLEAFLSFWSYFLLNNTMIPISLIVSLEFVKLAQAYFIEKDDDLFNRRKNRRATVFTSAINEELGQVEYLFTDKTGTLTCNEMEFKIAVIGDEMYGEMPGEGKPKAHLTERKTSRETQGLISHQPDQNVGKNPEEESKKEGGVNFSFHDERLTGLLEKKQGDKSVNFAMFTNDNSKKTMQFSSQYELAREYFTALSTCHECLVETDSDGTNSYQGPSPDEVTLVDAANRMGYSYIGGSENNKKITIMGQEKEFQVLHSFEFNSDRKRMSVILKDSQGQIKMYIKGADTIIKARLKHLDQQPYLKYIDQKLDVFARKGLRTLLIGMKVIDAAEYNAFYQKYMALADSDQKERELDKLADEIERGLYLIGATAVEDRLQDNVPETIFDLIQANIKVWMLTGDKMETAENIAKSCNLVQDDFQLMHCSEKTRAELEDVLLKHRKDHDYFLANGIRKALIVEGESLAVILGDETLTSLFVSITKTCEAVVCCRVTPKQKADVVRLIKKNLGKITLSIGDGANDVNMIQEAHIGVGIYGQEGMRAVQASDFALPEFQGLWRLLFIHGRWSYQRIAEMILYFFYKNMLFTIPQFYFAFVCAFSAQSVFDDFYITTYNLVFTSIPLLIRAAFDQDVNYKELDPNHPDGARVRPVVRQYFSKLYYLGQKNKLFGEKKFIRSVIQGLLHGVMVFLVTYFALYKTHLDSDGKSIDLYYFNITLYTSIIMIVDMKVAVYTKYWAILTPVSLIGLSLVLYFAYMWIIDSWGNYQISQTAEMLFTSMHFYLIVFFNLGVVFLLDIAYRYLRSVYFSELSDHFQSLIMKKKDNVAANFTRLFRTDEEKRAFMDANRAPEIQIVSDPDDLAAQVQARGGKPDYDSESKPLAANNNLSSMSLIEDGVGAPSFSAAKRRSDVKRIQPSNPNSTQKESNLTHSP